MAKQHVRELGRVLPDRIRLLARLIARKPPSYSSDWASSIDDAFRLYTRTSTVNLIHCLNQSLIEYGWPFPAYLDLRREIENCRKDVNLLRFPWLRWLAAYWIVWRGPNLGLIAFSSDAADAGMVMNFRRLRREVFTFLSTSKVLRSKQTILADVKRAFERKMWAACITTTIPHLDFVIRGFFGTEKLEVNIQVLRDAFIREAKLRPQDLMPGSAVWDGRNNPEKGNVFARSIEEDLRLPGIYLSSFFEFADRYYEWYKSSDATPRTPLNRHAVMHCASEFWTEQNAVRILTFLDLTVRLETVLKILIQGETAAAAVRNHVS